MDEGILIIDAELRILYANSSAENIFGVQPGQLIQSSLADFATPELLKVLAQPVKGDPNGSSHPTEGRIRTKNGEERLMLIKTSPWVTPENSRGGFFLTIQDLTAQEASAQSEQQHRTLAEALGDTAAALNNTLDIDELFNRILINVKLVVPTDTANIMLVEGDTVRVVKARGYENMGLNVPAPGISFTISKTPTFNQMMRTGQTIFVPDTKADKNWVNNEISNWIRSHVGAPILIDGEVVGVINIDNRKAGYFKPIHAEHLKSFADQAAIALRNARLYEREQNRARFLLLLNLITRIAISENDPDTMLAEVARLLYSMFNADSIHIVRWLEQEDTPQVVAGYGRVGPQIADLQDLRGKVTVTEMVLKAGKVLPISDLAAIHPQIAERFSMLASMLALPLLSDQEKIGSVLIGYRERREFTEEEINQANQAAGQVALAIKKAYSFIAERHRSHELARANHLITALSHVAAQIVSASASEHLLSTLGEELERLGIHCLVSIQQENEPALKYTSIQHLSPERLEKFYQLVAATSLFKELVRHHTPVYVPDLNPLVGYFSEKFSFSTESDIRKMTALSESSHGIFLPLILQNNIKGFIIVWGEDVRENDLASMSVFASQVAMTIENNRLYKTVQQMAITDDLTGLYNRRGWFELGDRELKSARRFKRQAALILVDVDHFKEVNDSYGHPVGDDALRQLTRRMRTILRETDLFSRYGGDEFTIFLPETGPAEAVTIANRLLKVICGEPFKTSAGPIKVTVSIGLTSTDETHQSLAKLFEKADQALYHAKAGGRGRVCCYNGPTPSRQTAVDSHPEA